MTTKDEALKLALEAHRALREWINAVPKDTPLPAMPGIDGDWLDEVEATICEALMSVPDGAQSRSDEEQPAHPSKPLTDEEIKRLKPISADFVSFRAGVRCVEREYGIGAKR